MLIRHLYSSLQIISVSIEDGNCVKVIFRPNKVSRRKEKEEFTTVMKVRVERNMRAA